MEMQQAAAMMSINTMDVFCKRWIINSEDVEAGIMNYHRRTNWRIQLRGSGILEIASHALTGVADSDSLPGLERSPTLNCTLTEQEKFIIRKVRLDIISF
jgi:hypothetical protein